MRISIARQRVALTRVRAQAAVAHLRVCQCGADSEHRALGRVPLDRCDRVLVPLKVRNRRAIFQVAKVPDPANRKRDLEIEGL